MPDDTDLGWTDERIGALKQLWLDGKTAAQIANELGGGATRNAVIGKVHRLGLSARRETPRPSPSPIPALPRQPSPPRSLSFPRLAISPEVSRVDRGRGAAATATAPRPTPRPVRQPRPSPAPQPIEAVVIPMSERVTLVELRESMCRWPLGDPLHEDFRFCGADSPIGVPYCAYHARIAYQPARDRRREQKEGHRELMRKAAE